MNRIYELAKEAGMIEFDVIPDSDAVTPNYTSVAKAQKFAELIVRECSRVAALTPCPYEDEYQKQTFGHTWDMACLESAREIRQHFGVE